MSIASTIAVSGLNAASLRVQVAASNIANAVPTPPSYQTLVVDQTATASGGTQASVTTANPATVPSAAPGAPYADKAGRVVSPAVGLTSQIVCLLEAHTSFAANVAVVRTDVQMSASLLNMLA